MQNCLIDKQGEVIDIGNGGRHDITCVKKLGIKLRTFLLKRGGVRVKLGWPDTESIAIEYHVRKPTDAQMQIIRRILRENDYYTLILVLKVIQKFRPIRGFQV